MERKRNRGFTLVELIVVLVVLSILAAIMVPTMIGWIDKAKEKKILLAARSLYTASQAVLSEEYAMCSDPSTPPTTESLKNSGRTAEILELAGTPEDNVSCSIGVMGGDPYGNYIVQYAYYSEDATGIAVYFNGSSWETVEKGTDVSKATICLKGTGIPQNGGITVPGLAATYLGGVDVSSLNGNSLTVFNAIEGIQKMVIEDYQNNKRSGNYGYRILFNGSNYYMDTRFDNIPKQLTIGDNPAKYRADNIVKGQEALCIVVNETSLGTNLAYSDIYGIYGKTCKFERKNNTLEGFSFHTYK